MMTIWTETEKQQPPDGQFVLVMDSRGDEQIVIRRGNTYRRTDSGLLVSYRPERWLLLTTREVASVKAEEIAWASRDCRDRLRRIEELFATKEAL